MKITKNWLKKHKACCNENDMNRAEKELKGDINLICNTLLKENRFSDANWVITKVMTKKQCIEYAIFAALRVIGIFEKEYPKDKRPRLAIEAAEKYLKNPCEKTRDAASYAANAVSYAIYAARAAICAACAAYAAIYTAYAAIHAASAAANAAADAATYAAGYAAYAATYAAMKAKIIENGLKILKGD